MQRIFSLLSVLFMAVLLPVIAHADGFGVNVTRLIYPQGADSISVAVRNTSPHPYLVQGSISRSQTVNNNAPFVVRPSLFRLEPNSTNQLRISALPANLPRDRESLFFFHSSAVPTSSAPAAAGQSRAQGQVQLGIGSVIKMFFRPQLPSTAFAAQQNLRLSRVTGGVRIENPSPYFVTLASLRIGGETIRLNTLERSMLAPFSNQTYTTRATGREVRWQTIGDEGSLNAFNRNLP